MTMRVWAGALLLFVLLVPVEFAGAQADDPRVDQARTEFESGEGHYEAGRYGLAAQDFQRAFELLSGAGHPRALMVLFNLGRTLERIPGREGEARAAYRRVIDEAPRTPEFESTLEMATVGLRELDARMGSRRASLSPVGPIVLGAGAAAVLAGLIMGGVALAQDADQVHRCPTRMDCPEDLMAEVEQTRTLAAVGDAVWIGGAVAAATGLILTLVLHEDPAEDTHVALVGSVGGGGVLLRGGFQ